MINSLPTGVIKNSKVVSDAPLTIGSGKTSKPVNTSGTAVQPQAKIIGQNESGAIIEVVCSCGQSLQVVCEFPPEMTPQNSNYSNGIQ